ncbi:MAG: hypothetical protein EP335_16750 [Alphaproteobacteria bacterium]|nr:MAG: hypothetical protein EP335_16750 [Alphaproteobacteria bacterium]
MKHLLAALLVAFLLAPAGRAEHFRIAIASEHDLYVGDLLRLALGAEGGGHTMEVVRADVAPQSQALKALESGAGGYDVLYSAYTPGREKRFAMVKFPLTHGMLGYRLLAVRDEKGNPFRKGMSLEELKANACFGSAPDWPDTDIMRGAGLCVATGNDENLWSMLARGRYTAFPRGLIEVMAELDHENGLGGKVRLILDQSVMLSYHQDLFFFLPKGAEAKADILQRGLAAALADGRYDRFLFSVPAIRLALQEVAKTERTTFHLAAGPQTTALSDVPAEYWYHFDNAATVAPYLAMGTAMRK